MAVFHFKAESLLSILAISYMANTEIDSFLLNYFAINRFISIFVEPNNNTNMKYDDFHKIIENNG